MVVLYIGVVQQLLLPAKSLYLWNNISFCQHVDAFSEVCVILIWCLYDLYTLERQKLIKKLTSLSFARFGKFYPLKLRTRKIPNSIMDRFFKKVNQKANPGRRQTPTRPPGHGYFKGLIFENPIQKSILTAPAFGFRGDKYETKKVRVVSLACNMPTTPYLCLYQILTKYFKPLRSEQEFGLEIRSWEITRKKNKGIVLLVCDTLTWPDLMSLLNIIKLSQTIWELWPAQYFGFRGDEYMTKKVRIVSLAHDTSSGHYLCLYQILSKYFKP